MKRHGAGRQGKAETFGYRLIAVLILLLICGAAGTSNGQETSKPPVTSGSASGSSSSIPAILTPLSAGVPAAAAPVGRTGNGSNAAAPASPAAKPGAAVGATRSNAAIPARKSDADAWRTEWRKKWVAQHANSATKAGAASTQNRHAVPAKATPLASHAPAISPSPASKPISSASVPAKTPVAPTHIPAPAAPAVPTGGEKTAPVTNRPPAQATTQTPTDKAESANALTAETRPDAFGAGDLNASTTKDRTLDSPLAAVGDSWKMIAYLIPVLLVMVVGLNLLRRFQERTGRMPGLLQSAIRQNPRAYSAPQRYRGGLVNALIGGFHLNQARQHGGGSIRLVESVPVGNANLHLIEVRGRLLLLGATGGGIALLTEFAEENPLGTDDFRTLLHAAAVDMDSLDLDASGLPTAAVVGALEEGLRDTGDTLARRVRRLRTVQEEEDAYVQG